MASADSDFAGDVVFTLTNVGSWIAKVAMVYLLLDRFVYMMDHQDEKNLWSWWYLELSILSACSMTVLALTSVAGYVAKPSKQSTGLLQQASQVALAGSICTAIMSMLLLVVELAAPTIDMYPTANKAWLLSLSLIAAMFDLNILSTKKKKMLAKNNTPDKLP